eukprot:2109247-Pleurochrysis_carterae.AAC.7
MRSTEHLRSCAVVLCVRVRPSSFKAEQQYQLADMTCNAHAAHPSLDTHTLTHAFASTQPRHMRPPTACTQAHAPCWRASKIPTVRAAKARR